MDIPPGTSGLLRAVLKKIADFFSMLLFYRAYEISTLYHNHREAFGIPPDDLLEGIEYKVLWKPYHLRKKLVTPMIWLRAKEKNSFSRVSLVVTASNSKIQYQDNITLYEVSDIPIQAALPSIPFRKIKFEGNTVLTPYDTIKIKVQELYDAEGDKVNAYYPRERHIRPFDRLEVAMGLQKGDIEKWGEIFNLEFLEMELREEKIRLIGPMFGRLKPVYYVRKKLFSINWIVKIAFWTKNIIFAKQLASEFVKYLEEHEAHKKWKEESQDKKIEPQKIA